MDAELHGHEGDFRSRHVIRLLEERPQESDCAKLDGAAKPHVGAAARRHKGVVCVIKVKVSGQLLGIGLTGVATVTPLLLLV